ncbi:HK97 family phage prohead protease [Neorhizobium sp. T786]|uniref:HK97 family phage prohead protease n=1 Tax=Pseudorhizobium xiangyangii TaxID=2883104 RepID=UPI001CFFEC22|nr:HK97 family phage prohead protease [Neorhizobium xiangyangii]MCB5201814.1 HK97 family phage prohead protease [Neorhizobium xiangyangii]
MEREVRSFMPANVRAEGNAIKVSGYAAVFNEETDIGGYFREVIVPGAFSEAIGRDDVVFLINHEGLPMARTRSGTLKLSEDRKGLFIEAELDPEDPDVKAIVPKMRRGDLDKMSFAFWPESQDWDDTKDPPLRSVRKARLYDVSIVTTPAYEGTEIGLRSLKQHRDAAQMVSAGLFAIRRRVRAELLRLMD